MTQKKTYIYALTDKSGVRYIGKADNVEKRFKNHYNESFNKKGKEYNLPKSRWIRKKVNEISYLILETCDYNEWPIKEVWWIAFYKNNNTNLLNIARGGLGGSGLKSLETRLKIGIKALGRKASKEVRKKMSESHIGKSKHLDKFKVSGKLNPHTKTILQFDLDNNFIQEWDTIRQAAAFYKKSPSTIHGCLSGKQKTSCNYIWKYKEQKTNIKVY